MNGISFDDLDDGVDLGDRCQSLTHGEKNGIALSDICVVAPTKKLVDDYIAQFTRAGIRSYAIKRNKTDDRNYDGLRVAAMHRVTERNLVFYEAEIRGY